MVQDGWTMDKNETDCQAPPEAPILCVNNCGFWGTPATMNMCSKCHKDMILKQEQAKLAASSIESIINGGTSINIDNDSAVPSQSSVALPVSAVGTEVVLSTQPPAPQAAQAESSEKPKEGPAPGPSRCTTCRKKVGLTGFSCRCENVFCSIHRYSDKHGCQFDYRATAKDAIAKANPVVKAEKLDKI